MIELRCQKTPYRNDVQFLLCEHRKDGHFAYGEEVILRTIGEGEIVPAPTFTMRQKECQQLMDELWQCGFRPSEGAPKPFGVGKTYLTTHGKEE